MRTFIIPFLLIAAITQAQVGPGPGLSGSGSIDAKREDKIRDENGNVTATKFTTYQYQVKWSVHPTDYRREVKPKVICANQCRKKVHPEHARCDFSCDRKCARQHRASMRGEYRTDFAGQRAAMQAARQLAVANGASPSEVDWSSAQTNALRVIRKDCERQQTFNVPHFCMDPCSSVERTYGLRQYDVMVTGTLVATEVTRSHGKDSPPVTKELGSHTNKVATAWYPDDKPISETPPVVKCLCVPADPPIQWFGTVPGDHVKGESLNYVVLIFGPREGRTIIVFYPGMILIAKNGKTQRMMIVDDVRQDLIAASAGDFSWLNPVEEKKARAVCINMELNEPDENDEFTISDEQDEPLERAAAMIAKSRFRGPWDQGLIWIMTDAATLGEINKKMIPGLSEQRWAESLRLAGEDCGFDFAGKSARCVMPDEIKPLLGPASPAAFTFLCRQLAAAYEKNKGALTMMSDAVKARLASGKQEDIAACACALEWMAGNNATEVALAGLGLLAAVPAEARGKLADAYAAAATQLFSLDPRARGAACSVSATLPTAGVKDELTFMAENDSDTSVRMAAKAAGG